MFKDILKVLGGTIGMIFKFIFIIGFAFGAFYCVFTMFMLPFIWEGLNKVINEYLDSITLQDMVSRSGELGDDYCI